MMDDESETQLPAEGEAYLRQVRLGLGTLSREDRDDLLAELRSHLRERHAQGKAPLLEGFEDAQTYAARFVSELALRGALARGTSLALGKALLTGIRSGLTTLLVVVPLIALQLIGAVLVLLGALKPFVPSRIGAFADASGRFVFLGGYAGDGQHAHEVLGWSAIPLFVVSGVLLLWAGNRTLHLLARRKLRTTAQRRGG